MGKPLLTPYDAPLKVDLVEYKGLALFATARAHRLSVNDDRVYDWAMDSLIRAAQTFDPSKGLKFKSYLIQKCNFDSIRRIETQYKRAEQGGKYRDLVSRGWVSDREVHRDNEETKRAQLIESELQGLDREIMFLRVTKGMTLNQVAEEVGLSKEGVRINQVRIVKELREKATT